MIVSKIEFEETNQGYILPSIDRFKTIILGEHSSTNLIIYLLTKKL